MGLIDTLEYRLGRFAIPGSTRILVIAQAIVFLLIYIDGNTRFFNLMVLDREAVLAGQVWRLVSYMFLPVTLVPLFFIFASWITWFVGNTLEQAWGPFRLNLFLVSGMAAVTIVAFVFDVQQTNTILMMTLFLAFATMAPDFEFLLFFVLPVKVKWLAWIDVAFLAFMFIDGSLGVKATVVAGVANYLLFFGPAGVRAAFFKRQVAARRNRFEAAVQEAQAEALHSCKVCGRTDTTHPNLDFRIARDGEEYCLEHLPSRQPEPQQ